MTLWDESLKTCKAILWTKFTHVNLKTGRKEKHNEAFSDFVKSVLVDGVDLEGGPQKRPSILSNAAPKL
jgi:acyl-CoA thioester hydrolase